MKALARKGLVLCLIVLALGLLGCGATPEKQSQTDFKVGWGGLQVDMLENAPPREVFPQTNFKIVLDMHNTGAYDITKGEVRILGLDGSYFAIDPTRQDFPLETDVMLGRSLTNPRGDRVFVEFSGLAKDLFHGSEQYVASYFVKVDYESNFEFSDTVCINPDLYDVYTSGCSVDSSRSYRGQGAPVGVSRMEEFVSPGEEPEVQFRLVVSNRGSGDVGSLSFKGATLGTEAIDCYFPAAPDGSLTGIGTTANTVEFKDGREEVLLLCSKKFTRDFQSYTTTLHVDFEYDYSVEERPRIVLTDPEKTRLR